MKYIYHFCFFYTPKGQQTRWAHGSVERNQRILSNEDFNSFVAQLAKDVHMKPADITIQSLSLL